MHIRFSIALVFLVPTVSHASVIINEIAWMGTLANANDEWIELYNTGDSSASLEGWILSDGVSLTINLAGTVGQGEYALLERTDDTTVPDVTALQVYSGALANDGRTLTLKRSDGSTEDSVAGGADWSNTGGNNVTKDTPQWTGTKWVTGTPTPGEVNISSGAVHEEEEEETSDTTTENTTTSSRQTVSASKTNSGGGSKKQAPAKKVPPELVLEVVAPRTAYVNQEISFEAVPSGVGETIARSLSYTWNFGDIYVGVGKKPTHVFTYPGEYIVVVEGVFAKQRTLARQEVTVLPVSFALGVTPTGDITIKNNAKYEVDLGGFTLSGASAFTFPKYTILRAGGTLTVPKVRIGGGQSVALYDTERTLVTSYGTVSKPIPQALAQATIPPASSSEAAEKVEKKEEVSSATIPKNDTVIQIGTAKREEPRGIAGFFKKLVSFFGL